MDSQQVTFQNICKFFESKNRKDILFTLEETGFKTEQEARENGYKCIVTAPDRYGKFKTLWIKKGFKYKKLVEAVNSFLDNSSKPGSNVQVNNITKKRTGSNRRRKAKKEAEKIRLAEIEKIRKAESSAKRKIELENIKKLSADTDLMLFYPEARTMKRKFIVVLGETNSGKTYKALERLKEMKSGCYLAPLRLLAMENFDRLNSQGCLTSLITGELIKEIEGAKYTSSTIEMANFNKQIEMAIVDEVQMVVDRDRGSAWLSAIMGVPAKEIWLLGTPEIKDVLVSLFKAINVEEKDYKFIYTERLTKNKFIVLEDEIKYEDIKPKTAIIAFSRRKIINIAEILSHKHNKKVSIIYGAIPPEVRKQQAENFANGITDIVVATDAIGMGMNLPIDHIIFSEVEKYDGQDVDFLDPHLLWQIVGRAGRYKEDDENVQPTIGAIDKYDLDYLKEILENRPDQNDSHLTFSLNYEIAMALNEVFNCEDSIVKIVYYFNKMKNKIGCVPKQYDQDITTKLDYKNLSLKDKLTLLHSPIDENNCYVDVVCKKIISNNELLLKEIPLTIDFSSSLSLENAIKNLNYYLWLSYRYKKIAIEPEKITKLIKKINDKLNRMLSKLPKRLCKICNKPLDYGEEFDIHEKCYLKRKNIRNGYYWLNEDEDDWMYEDDDGT